MATERLTRSTDDRWIAGVCGGIGRYFGWDPTVVRLLWIVSVTMFGFGVLAYVVLWILLPENGAGVSSSGAMRIAEERYARGEIDAEEFARIKGDLER
jgi:phage shock protein C